jgi:hypothetical protein
MAVMIVKSGSLSSVRVKGGGESSRGVPAGEEEEGNLRGTEEGKLGGTGEPREEEERGEVL